MWKVGIYTANDVQANRLTGVHVTPTVLFNVSKALLPFLCSHVLIDFQGVVEGGISSSFSKEDWEQWLEKNIV